MTVTMGVLVVVVGTLLVLGGAVVGALVSDALIHRLPPGEAHDAGLPVALSRDEDEEDCDDE